MNGESARKQVPINTTGGVSLCVVAGLGKQAACHVLRDRPRQAYTAFLVITDEKTDTDRSCRQSQPGGDDEKRGEPPVQFHRRPTLPDARNNGNQR